MNTQDIEIDWDNVNSDDTAKLKALKRLIEEWESQLPAQFCMIALKIITNTMYTESTSKLNEKKL